MKQTHPLEGFSPGEGSGDPGRPDEAGGEQLLHRLVEAQVRRTPAAVAVQHGEELVTYADLDRRADAMALVLRAHGVGPDSRVVVALQPGTDLLVTLLATLKAGGCFVPVAGDVPRARLSALLAGTGARVVVADTARVADEVRGSAEVVLPGTPTAVAARDGSALRVARPEVDPEQLAYVIHTSGSTGTPKGVMVPHRGITNTLRWRQRRFPFRSTDRVLLTFSFVFDASLFEIFQPLMSGARVVVPERPLGGDPAETVGAIRRFGITVLGVVPSLLELLLEDPGVADCTSLRLVFCGGERLTQSVADRFRSRSRAELVNVYGPTEASLEATFWSPRSALPLSIGRPIDGATAHVLDERLGPVSPGASGELFLGGAGVARGYCADPRLTAERFVPDPFSAVPGARMYRTGDRCRWTEDGCLDYLGRLDDQVKLRGQRIELGEVEAALLSHPSVREASVVLDERGRGGGRLVAYVVATASGRPTKAGLRRHLADHLPAAVLPAETVFLDALARTPSGKVDRRSLPRPRPSLGGPGRRAALPATGPVEDLVRDLWLRVLEVPSVADDADFFELGGSSVQAAILAHVLEDALGEFVYPVAVYDAPTVAELSDYVRENYADAVLRRWGSGAPVAGPEHTVAADTDALRRLQLAVRPLPDRSDRPADPGEPLAPAVFVLSPPRSGSTLLRVVLGVHPGLFAPPELQLLNFTTLRERRRVFSSERDSFWLQGSVRAIMELLGCGPERAERVMADCERRNLSVPEFYGYLQALAGDRMLVDKTPTYALDPVTLRRAEQVFREPLYLHLVRDPRAAVASFEEARLQVFFPAFFRSDPRLGSRQLAESVWTLSQRNILDFLREVPGRRRHVVRYEDLVGDPEATLRRVTAFLGLPFDPAMVRPYEQDQRRLMTDPVRPLGRMLGDVKFHEHRRIRADDPRRRVRATPVLGEPTRRVAAQLGYRTAPAGANLVTLQSSGRPPGIFCVHPAAGTASCYAALAAELGGGLPFHGLRSTAGPEDGVETVCDLAAAYLRQVLEVQPRGPYHLAGWSFGGLVAFEMARQLRRRGRRLGRVLLFGAHLPPDVELPFPSPREFILTALRERLAEYGDAAASSFHDLDGAFAAARRTGLVAPGQDQGAFMAVMEQHERTYRRHVAMARAYRPSGVLPDLVVFDPLDTSLDDRGSFPGWTSVADNVERIIVPGNHFTMLTPPHVQAVAKRLRPLLRTAPAFAGRREA
ncbi:amino acid adenylation domain-containing protein [Nocardioides sp.]|uniref:non-ribosomal peptide synthetase family protein n=1 Tax=Nocardioides sp. TaxID=35761 RepID=UPI0031FE9C13|nr:amino acid adenylation domain protein [Nocardioides sp.]